MRIEWFFIWTNLNPLHQKMHCAKFGWNWRKNPNQKYIVILNCTICFLWSVFFLSLSYNLFPEIDIHSLGLQFVPSISQTAIHSLDLNYSFSWILSRILGKKLQFRRKKLLERLTDCQNRGNDSLFLKSLYPSGFS